MIFVRSLPQIGYTIFETNPILHRIERIKWRTLFQIRISEYYKYKILLRWVTLGLQFRRTKLRNKHYSREMITRSEYKKDHFQSISINFDRISTITNNLSKNEFHTYHRLPCSMHFRSTAWLSTTWFSWFQISLRPIWKSFTSTSCNHQKSYAD